MRRNRCATYIALKISGGREGTWAVRGTARKREMPWERAPRLGFCLNPARVLAEQL